MWSHIEKAAGNSYPAGNWYCLIDDGNDKTAQDHYGAGKVIVLLILITTSIAIKSFWKGESSPTRTDKLWMIHPCKKKFVFIGT